MAKRNLYLSNKPIEEALALYKEALIPCVKKQTEWVDVIEGLDRVTAGPVFAFCNSPLYDSAAMDGIAVCSSNTLGAREAEPLTLELGKEYIVVDTGDPVLPPFDGVIMAEEIEELEPGKVQIRSSASAWQHIRPVGEDIVKGEMILPSRHLIRPIDIGVLLSGGMTSIEVWKRPEVAVFPTGTEMVEPGQPVKQGDIIESNSRMFEAMVQKNGGVAKRFAPIPDDYNQIKQAIEKAVQEYDMVIINAGSSAGTEDYTVHVLRELGQVVVHGVAMKPGKPVILALVEGKPVIGLPGYPVSAYIAYQNFVLPILEWMTGLPEQAATSVPAILTRRVVSSLKHREYVRVKVGKVGGKLVASPLARGAGAAMSLVRADGFCIVEQNREGVQAGEEIEVVLTRSLPELEKTVVGIGSHDLMLDLLADWLPEEFPGHNLSSTHVGSMGGLMALKRGEAHFAPIHLLDSASGLYNVPVVKSLFPDIPMGLVKGVGRTQGLMVQKGNPLEIQKISDLTKARYINRQRGAGTRSLLDYLLGKEGIDTEEIQGYGREGATHMAVAAAVQSGSADAGLGVLSAARAMGLDFIPIADEEYDFVLPQEFLELDSVKAFIDVLKNKKFLTALEQLGGYTTLRCGEVEYIGG